MNLKGIVKVLEQEQIFTFKLLIRFSSIKATSLIRI